jgi:hypothetical protein
MSSNIQFANYFSTSLAAPLAAAATSMLVTNPVGLPAITGNQYFYLTLVDLASYSGNVSPPAQVEVVKVTAVAGSTLTIVRGQDGTAAQNFAVGDVVQNRVNAAALSDIVGNAGDVVLSGNLVFDALGSRILGDMSNGDLASRVTVQTTTPNAPTAFQLMPNGSATIAGFVVFNSSDLANTGYLLFLSGAASHTLSCGFQGGGTVLPISCGVGGVPAFGWQVDLHNNLIHGYAIADQSRSYQNPATGFVITFANNISTLLLDPAGTLASGQVWMPLVPVDGQIVRFSSTQEVTALAVLPQAGQTLKNAPTTIAAGQGFAWIYVLGIATWFRLY